MLPVLEAYRDGTPRASSEVRAQVAAVLKISAQDQDEMLPVARQTRFANRAAWAHSYLKQAGLLESPRRAQYRITDRGRQVLASGCERIDIAFLDQFPDFQEFRARSRGGPESGGNAAIADGQVSEATLDAGATLVFTPEEQIRDGYARQRAGLAEQLLERVKQGTPQFFEWLVVQLLVAMGYGGTVADAAQTVGRSGDGGIDGTIKEDRLGLDFIYIQAKRWEGTVGRPTIQQFAGALQGKRARRGVVITTSTFSKDAVDYANTLATTIVLVDGPQLAQLMIEYGVGVSEMEVIRLQRIDEDYFEAQ